MPHRRQMLKMLFAVLLTLAVFSPDTLVREASTQRDYLLGKVLTDQARIYRITGSKEISDAVMKFSHEHKLNPYLVVAVMQVESHFNPRAKSHAGAIGLMQLLPIAVRDIPHLKDVMSRDDLWQPTKNVEAGVTYLAMLNKRFHGDLRLVLTAYNAGPTFVSRQIKNGGVLPNGYYNKVMKSWQKFQPSIIRSARVRASYSNQS